MEGLRISVVTHLCLSVPCPKPAGEPAASRLVDESVSDQPRMPRITHQGRDKVFPDWDPGRLERRDCA